MNIELQVLGSALRSIAEEMGAVLVRSSFSANIKERRDCSAALFDERGRMIAQAEHIPVHLGAMPDAVAAVMAEGPERDDVFVLNDPYAGGTHLPDITLVSRTEVGFAVTRAHHADVGGSEPGSMPADSRTLDDEGVVIPPTRLDDEVLAGLVSRMRNPEERRGDFRAQLAAHHLAERRLTELCERRGRDRIVAAMDSLFAYSERVVRSALSRLPDGRFEGTDVLEAGEEDLPIRVAVTIAADEIAFDFSGTAPQHAGNLNCPLSVTRSACYFVVRCLTAPDLPSSGGAFAPVSVSAPEGSLVNARPPAAVAAGNVETSCRIVIFALGLLGLVLASTFVLLRNANSLSNLLEYPVWLVTGLLVGLSLLPGWTRPISYVLAPTWGIRGMREAALGGDPAIPVAICLGLGLVYLVIGHFTLGYFEVRARRSATLALR